MQNTYLGKKVERPKKRKKFVGKRQKARKARKSGAPEKDRQMFYNLVNPGK